MRSSQGAGERPLSSRGAGEDPPFRTGTGPSLLVWEDLGPAQVPGCSLRPTGWARREGGLAERPARQRPRPGPCAGTSGVGRHAGRGRGWAGGSTPAAPPETEGWLAGAMPPKAQPLPVGLYRSQDAPHLAPGRAAVGSTLLWDRRMAGHGAAPTPSAGPRPGQGPQKKGRDQGLPRPAPRTSAPRPRPGSLWTDSASGSLQRLSASTLSPKPSRARSGCRGQTGRPVPSPTPRVSRRRPPRAHGWPAARRSRLASTRGTGRQRRGPRTRTTPGPRVTRVSPFTPLLLPICKTRPLPKVTPFA